MDKVWPPIHLCNVQNLTEYLEYGVQEVLVISRFVFWCKVELVRALCILHKCSTAKLKTFFIAKHTRANVHIHGCPHTGGQR